MKKNLNKYILVHSGNRDYYQVALALHEAGNLKFLVTDDFDLRKDKPTVLKGSIKISYTALFINLLGRIFKGGKLNFIKDRLLSLYTYHLTKVNSDDIVLAYSYYSTEVFSKFEGKKVLFQLHPHPNSVRQIFFDEINSNHLAKQSLSQEHELLLSDYQFKRLSVEPHQADAIIVASSFTKETLIENNVPPDKISVIPYGVNLASFEERKTYKRESKELNVIFVGSINQRKGLSYLAEACKLLQERGLNVKLNVVGRGIVDEQLVRYYNLKNCNLYYNVNNKELVHLYHKADVFVLPSLCEGFGHVILEAMATGLPVITTPNTAGIDVIKDGEEGFIVPIRNSHEIAERLSYLYFDPEANISMGKKAAVKARTFTWERFRVNLNKALEKIEKE